MATKAKIEEGKIAVTPHGGPSSRLAALGNRATGDGPADWSSVDGRYLAAAIGAVASSGGALRFGYTRDGGAYAIGIYDGGDHKTLYIRPSEDVHEHLQSIIDAFGKPF